MLLGSCYYYILKRMDGLFLKMPSTMVRNIKKVQGTADFLERLKCVQRISVDVEAMVAIKCCR